MRSRIVVGLAVVGMLAAACATAGKQQEATGRSLAAPNIVMASTFVLPPAFVQANAGSSFGNPETLGEDLPNLYTRWSNPTVRSLQDNVASSCGMAAPARAKAATASTRAVGDQERVVRSTQVNRRKRRHIEQAKGAAAERR